MKITILTLFPEFFDSFKTTSIIKRSIESDSVALECVNFRDYTLDKHNNVDDTICGGGAGMLLSCQPIVDAIKDKRDENTKVVLLSPQGKPLKQDVVHTLVEHGNVLMVCGHYEGFDERIREYVDEEISIGDYVLTGGEPAAIVLCDAMIRLSDGVIRATSHQEDSYENGLLEYPQYTRPITYDGKEVPEVLLSGHHEKIRKWRLQQSLYKTYKRRPDLLQNRSFTKEEKQMLEEIIAKEAK